MSSTMQAWRTDQRLSQTEMYNTINAFFSGTLQDYWTAINNETTGQVDYYISDNIFLRVIHNGNNHGIKPCCGNVEGTTVNFSVGTNITIYKINSCMVICAKSAAAGSSLPYSKEASLIIDSTNSGEGKSLIYTIGTASSSTMFDSSSSSSMSFYTPYNQTSSLKTDTNLAQIVPLKNNILDKSFDNLHGVLLTPVMNDFVSLQNEKWLFTRGMALSAGSEVPTPVDIETVQSSS